MGDVAGRNRFDNLAVMVQKDLDLVKLAHRRGKSVPRFHVESKSFNIVQCNTDLSETELEINIIRGISYNVSKPKDVDTYIKIEFPYPQVSGFNSLYFNSHCCYIIHFPCFLSNILKLMKIISILIQETPYKNKTEVIYNTDNPEYNAKFICEIQPKSRNCQRIFKRHGIKLEVWSRG